MVFSHFVRCGYLWIIYGLSFKFQVSSPKTKDEHGPGILGSSFEMVQIASSVFT